MLLPTNVVNLSMCTTIGFGEVQHCRRPEVVGSLEDRIVRLWEEFSCLITGTVQDERSDW